MTSSLVLLALLQSAPPPAVAPDSEFAEAVRYVETAAAEHRRSEGTPGMAIALVADGAILAVRTLGVADLTRGTPVTPETRFLAGSISKSFTAAALLQLQEEGLVDLRRPVTTYLPWFKVRSRFEPITLHQLLTHTAGLPRDRSDLPSSPYTAVALRDREIAAPPGARFAYSNIGYQLLSLVIEEVEGRPFVESIRSRIIEPLGLTGTVAAVTQEDRQACAVGYQYLYDDRPPAPGDPLVPAGWPENSGGDANIVTTAPDLARFLNALLAQGGPRGHRLLQPASFARMVQRTVPAPVLGAGMYYGYGVVLGTADGDPILWHSGGMPGFRSMMLGDLDERLGVVVLMNGPGNPRRLAEYALSALVAARRRHHPPPVPVPAPPDVVPEAAQYAGSYQDSAGRVVNLRADGDHLSLEDGGRNIPLFRDGADSFLALDSAWRRFPLRFGRQEGRVVELLHGGRWLPGTAWSGPRQFPVPAAWQAYVGHYRAQVPYYSNYRVVIRKGQLLLVSPEGLEDVLVAERGNRFRVGSVQPAVEWVEFADLVSGRALRLNLSGTDYYRATTP